MVLIQTIWWGYIEGVGEGCQELFSHPPPLSVHLSGLLLADDDFQCRR